MAMSITVDAEFINEAIIEKIQTTSIIDLTNSTVSITMTRTGAGANATVEIPSTKKKKETAPAFRATEVEEVSGITDSNVVEEYLNRDEEEEAPEPFAFSNAN